MKRLFILFFACVFVCAAQTSAPTFEELSAKAASARDANALPQAMELYRQALKIKPDWQEGWWFLGTLAYDSNQYGESRDALTRFVALRPDSGPAWGLLGLAEFETKQYPQALDHIEHCFSVGISGAPELEGALRYHEALLLAEHGDYEKAQQQYVWFAKKGVQNPQVLLGVGLAALRTPHVPSDIPAAQQDLYLTAGKASYLAMSGDFAGAQSGFKDLLQRYSNAPNVHYLYGCYLLGANPESAMDELKKELEVNPASTAARSMLAWVLINEGEPEKARPYAAQAVRESPNTPLAQYVFGRALVETGDVKTGIEHLERAEKMDPANPEDHITLAAAYSKAGRSEDARREREQSLEMTRSKDAVAQP